MPETPEQFVERANRLGLRIPPLEEWDSWPFLGAATPRPLEAPVDEEPPRHGAGGVECRQCARGDTDALWADEHWIVRALEPSGLPMAVLLFTRAHVDFPELDDRLAAELGPMLLKVQRAVLAIPDIGNVHVCRWGDGSEHLHVWFMARPARVPQLVGSFAAIWDDIVPPLPEDVWRANVEIVRNALSP